MRLVGYKLTGGCGRWRRGLKNSGYTIIAHVICERDAMRYKVATFQKNEPGNMASWGTYRNVAKEIRPAPASTTLF